MFNCEQVLAELASYLDDEVVAEIRQELEHHLAECKTCSVIYDSTRKTIRVVTDSGSFEIPEEVSARMTKRIMAKVRETSPPESKP
ncbi:MAG: zf-HC2 domain-containing protein [Acidobacteria bacterium]|nr:zf-HC2 domain-containing protein [Acidobacteriota bacterium]